MTTEALAMIIRHATMQDVPRFERFAKEFYESTHYHQSGIPLEIKAVYDTIAYTIQSDDGTVIIAEEDGKLAGATCLLVQGLWLAPAHKTGIELFYYVFPEYRSLRTALSIFDEMERHLREVGAHSFNMVALENQDPRIKKLYERRGFQLVESTYMRRF